MNIRVLEEVTCDECGAVYTFEKMSYCPSGQTFFRVATLPDFLITQQGWQVDNKCTCGICPRCISTVISNETQKTLTARRKKKVLKSQGNEQVTPKASEAPPRVTED